MKKIPEISKALRALKLFRGKDSPTKREIVVQVMINKGLFSKGFTEVDNETFRERGCEASGGCGCTGRCFELVPVTEIDRMCQVHYLEVLALIENEVETNLEAYTNG
jgi:hypothetical protein